MIAAQATNMTAKVHCFRNQKVNDIDSEIIANELGKKSEFRYVNDTIVLINSYCHVLVVEMNMPGLTNKNRQRKFATVLPKILLVVDTKAVSVTALTTAKNARTA